VKVASETKSLDQVFVQAVRERNQALIKSPYSDGVKTMAVSIAALESAAQGTVVRVG